MNLSPASVIQDTDIKKNNFLGAQKKQTNDNDFASFVEQQRQTKTLMEKQNKRSDDTKNINEQVTATNDNYHGTCVINEKEESATHLGETKKTDRSHDNHQIKLDEHALNEVQADKSLIAMLALKERASSNTSSEDMIAVESSEVAVDKVAMLKSEKFISLLYRSDQALVDKLGQTNTDKLDMASEQALMPKALVISELTKLANAEDSLTGKKSIEVSNNNISLSEINQDIGVKNSPDLTLLANQNRTSDEEKMMSITAKLEGSSQNSVLESVNADKFIESNSPIEVKSNLVSSASSEQKISTITLTASPVTDKGPQFSGNDQLSAQQNLSALEQKISTASPTDFVTTDKVTQAAALQNSPALAKLLLSETMQQTGLDTDAVLSEENMALAAELSSLKQDNDILTKLASKQNQVDNVARAFAEISSQSTQVKQATDAYNNYQNIDVHNQIITTDVAETQKNNIQLNQEKIAIYRKDFSDAVKDKVLLMVSQKLQQFDITLDPPEFGNMQIRVNLQGEQAAVNFVVQNQQAKEALEQNMHKLREMLAEQGVEVGDASVEQQSQQNSQGQALQDQHVTSGSSSTTNENQDSQLHELSVNKFNSPTTGVDYYA